MAKVQKVTTQLVPTKVQQDAANEGRRVVAMANAITVETVREEEKAYDGLKQISSALKHIEAERKKITKPLDDSKKAVQSLFKQLKEPFEQADGIIREKVLTFHQEQQRRADEERRKLEEQQRKAEERAARLREQGKERAAEKAEVRAEELEEDASDVVPEVATKTVVTTRWTFDIVNAKRVPREYCEPDRRLIRQAVNGGVRDIPGVEIYQEEGLRV